MRLLFAGLLATATLLLARVLSRSSPSPASPPSPTADDWLTIEAKHYRQGRNGEILWLVVHTAEGNSSARGLAQYFAKDPDKRTVSTHLSVDAKEIIRSVRDEDTAYTAGQTGNRHGLHVELTPAFAAWSPPEWSARGPMLSKLAEALAFWSARHGIPLEELDAEGVKAKKRGVTTHAVITKAFGETSHTDPGSSFPMAAVLAEARARLAA